MNSESKLILDLWESLRDVIPAGRREDAALKLLKCFEDYDYEIVASELEGEDNYLDAALEAFKDDEEDEDDYSYDDE